MPEPLTDDPLAFLPRYAADDTLPEAVDAIARLPLPLYLKRATLAHWARRDQFQLPASALARLTMSLKPITITHQPGGVL